MNKQSILKSTLCLLMALMCNVAWAQTSSDGPIVTFTNVQKDGTTYTLYINNDNVLATSTESAETLGEAAKFRATLQSNGTYTFYNESKSLYMIWRGKSEGANGDKGVLAEYNEDFCNWTLGFGGSSNKTGTYFFYAKRKNTGKYGTLVIMKSNGAFDGWNETAAWADNYSNLYTINSEEYLVTLTDASKNIYEFSTSGIPKYSNVTNISNPIWKDGNLFADVAFSTPIPFPVSTKEITNQVIISTFSNYNNKYFADGTSVKANRVNTNTNPLPENVDAKNYLWAFYPEVVDNAIKFKIKNIGTNTYIQSESEQNDHSGDEVTLVESESNASSFDVTSANQLVNSKGYRLSVNTESANSSVIQNVGTHQTDHNGTKNKFANANNYTLTLSDGSTYTGNNGVQNLMGGSYTYTNEVWSDNGYSATVDFSFPFPVSTAEETKATLLANWGNSNNNSEKKWHAVLENGVYNLKVQTKNPDITELNTWKWAIYPQLSNGVFTFKIKNMHTGTYVYANPENTANAQGSKGYIVLKEEGTVFTIVKNGNFINLAYVGKNSTTLKLTTNGSGDTDVYLGSYAGTHAGNHINWPDLTVYSATIPATGYSAIYTPFAVSIPNGVEVYAGTVEGNWVIPSKISGTVIPTNTAVILKGTASTTYTFNKTEDAAEAIGNNGLKGATEFVSLVDEQGYVMQTDVEVFKLQKENIAPYTAYITRPQGSAEVIGLFNEGYVLANHGGFVNGGVYTFVTARGQMGATEAGANAISTARTTVADTNTDYFKWIVYKSINGYYLYNLGKQKFMGVQSNNNAEIAFVATPAGRTLTFKKSNSATHPIMFSTDNAGVVNHSANHGGGLINWADGWNNLGDEGSNHQVTLVDKLTEDNLATIAEVVKAYELGLVNQATEALRAAITAAQSTANNGLGEGLGYYTSTDANYASILEAADEFKNGITVETTAVDEIIEQTEIVNDLFTLNVPEVGKYYRIKSKSSGKYLDAAGLRNEVMNMKSEADRDFLGSIFLLDEGSKWLNMATNTYIKDTHTIGADKAGANTWTFEASPRTLGCLLLKSSGGSPYLHDSDPKANRCSGDGGHAAHDFIVEEVEEPRVTMSSAAVDDGSGDKYIATLFTSVAVEVPAGITAYIGMVEGNYLKLAAIEGTPAIIPANTGVILMTDEMKTYFFKNYTASEVGNIANNDITGTVEKTLITPEANTTYYVLARPKADDGVSYKPVGFYKASLNYYGNGDKIEEGAEDGTSFYNNAGKAYIAVPTNVVEEEPGQAARALTFRFTRGDNEGTTDLEKSEIRNHKSEMIFDLTGRRIEKIVEKGIYIVNGKKVVIR